MLGSDLKFHPHIYSGYYMYIRRFLESHTNVVVVPPPIIAVRYHSQRNVNLGGRGGGFRGTVKSDPYMEWLQAPPTSSKSLASPVARSTSCILPVRMWSMALEKVTCIKVVL